MRNYISPSKLAYRLYYLEPLKKLSLHDKDYCRAISEIFELQLIHDKANNDVTSRVVFGNLSKNISNSRVVAKQNGIVSGIEEVSWFLKNHSPISCRMLVKNGDLVKRGQTLITIRGTLANLMAYERLILNMIGHLSGITTNCAEISKLLNRKKNSSPLIASTRKTRFGPLDKRACLFGGVEAHRINLADAILIKHNHLFAASGNVLETVSLSYSNALKLISGKNSPRFFEVEVTSDVDVFTVSEFFQKNSNKHLPCVLMLDNFSSKHATSVIAKINNLFKHRNFVIECSGGISKKNVLAYAKSGADVLSLGSLTHSSKFFDVSMRMVETQKKP